MKCECFSPYIRKERFTRENSPEWLLQSRSCAFVLSRSRFSTSLSAPRKTKCSLPSELLLSGSDPLSPRSRNVPGTGSLSLSPSLYFSFSRSVLSGGKEGSGSPAGTGEFPGQGSQNCYRLRDRKGPGL